jgi:hypothetical protein
MFFTLIIYANNQNILNAVRIKSLLKIDGKLTEEVWAKAISATGFLQKEPDEGEKASFKTEVRVLYDDKNLYIGIKCFDSEPDKIFAKQMERDGDFSSDDSVSVIINTYRDLRNGFLFIVNPNGAKYDAYITDEGKYRNTNWNGIWEVKSAITEFGWSAEIKIPFSTLKFDSKNSIWGINFKRFIARKNEEVLWTAYHRNEGIMLISKAGILKGIEGIKRENSLHLRPYILAGIQKEPQSASKYKLRTGLDLKYSLTSSLTLDFTAHPDFGQVEVDRKRINLTRFSLFYPEKREFFLEGAGIFSFGITGRVQPLYTRRIGLSPDREEIPILGGARLTGKAGKYDIGVFGIGTARNGEYASTNYSAIRMRREILEKSYVGFIATNRYSDGKFNSSFGIDGALSFSNFLGNNNLIIGGFAAKTYDSETKNNNNTAYQLYVDYPNNLFDIYLRHYVIEENFRPEMGFVYRTGIKRFDWQIKTRPRINKAGFKYFVFKIKNYRTLDLSGNLLEDFYEYRLFGFETRGVESFELNFQTRKEFLDEDFEIYEGIIINKGMYKEKKWEIQFDTSKSRTLSAAIFYNFGDFYTGKRKELILEGRIKISRVFSLNIDYSYNNISLSNGKFKTYEPAVWINFNPTTNFFTSAFLQYNNKDKELVANIRLHLIPKAKSHIYLVYSEVLMTDNSRLSSKKRTILFKIAYNF